MKFEWINSLMTIISGALGRATIQATIGIVTLLLIERAVPWLRTAWRSWLWRLLYLKIAIVLCVPIACTIPLLPSTKSTSSITITPDSDARTASSVTIWNESDASSSAANSPVPRTSLVSLVAAIAFGAWSAGVSGLLILLTIQWVRIQRLVKRAKRCVDPMAASALRGVCIQMRARSLPQLLSVEGLRSPMVVGYLQPRILWPEACFNRDASKGSETEDRRMALAHETAHVLRRDLWWNLLVSAVNTVLWFHPLVWLAGRRYLASQEAACDELAVLRARLDRTRFADLLIRVSQNTGLCDWRPAGVPLIQGHGVHLLRERLITMQRSRSDSVGRLTAVAALSVGLVLAVLPWTIGAADSRPASASKKNPRTVVESSDGISVSASASGSSSASGFASGSGSSGGSARRGSSGGSQSGGNSSGNAGSSTASNAKSSVSVNIGGAKGVSSSTPGTANNSFGSRTGNTKKSSSSSTTAGAQVTTNREMTEDGEEIRVTVQEKLRDIQLRQSDADGIEVFIRPSKKNPNQTVTNVTAETAEELKEKDPQAFEVYRKYLQSNLDKIRDSAVATQKSQANIPADGAGSSNPAQQLMVKHLRELLENDNLPAANRAQIEQMLNDLK